VRAGRFVAVLTLCWTALLAVASAQTEPGPSAASTSKTESASPSDYWARARVRPFVAGTVDAGAMLRGKLMLGYGKPHWTWGGLEAEAMSSTEMGLTAVRARVALMVADVAVAYRRTWAYRRQPLMRQAHYDNDDLRGRPRARYHSLDIWSWGLIPVGDGFIDWEVEASRLYGVPRGMDVFEEWLRTPVRPPWAVASRLGYAHQFLSKRLAVGAMAEWVWPGPRGSLVRVGPLANYAFGPHWDAAVLLMAYVHGPDDLRFFTGLWGTVRLRFKFASGERGDGSPFRLR
jgi:hypothetical protein